MEAMEVLEEMEVVVEMEEMEVRLQSFLTHQQKFTEIFFILKISVENQVMVECQVSEEMMDKVCIWESLLLMQEKQ
jgi:hypothetical protein